MKKQTQRNIPIEILRCVCALLVILTHVLNKNYQDSAGIIRDRVCSLNTICIVAVPCFFMITGFFARKGQSSLKKIRQMAISVLVPTLIAILIYQALWAWISGESTFFQSVQQADYRQIWSAVVTWSINKLPGCSPFWYVTTYVQLILLFPVISLLCTNERETAIARRVIFSLCIFAYLVKDMQQVIPFEGTMYKPFDRSVVYFLLGYEASLIDWRKISYRYLVLGAGAGFISMYLFTRLIYMHSGTFSDYFFHYETVPCVLASVCVFGLCLKFKMPEISSKKRKCVILLADASFYVYLTHNAILNFLMENTQWKENRSLPWLLALWAVTAIMSFAISLAIRKAQRVLKHSMTPAVAK